MNLIFFESNGGFENKAEMEEDTVLDKNAEYM